MTPMETSAPRTARARVRAEMLAEIKEVARRHLAVEGAAGLSLRAVARDLGMVSSAVYRYFASRDDLLTALIIDAFDAVGAAAEEAEQAASGNTTPARWLALSAAVRDWARRNPQEYALVYGSPVPGYRAPTATIDPALRVTAVFLRLLAEGVAAGEITTGPPRRLPRTVHADLATIRASGAAGVPDAVLVRALGVWTQLFGAISYELFGHLNNVIHDGDGLFAAQMHQAAAFLMAGA
jgi:AcrR family transcriptional regulator